MTDENENSSLEDRFEMLKSLLKHQIKANEVLKSELAQLSKLYQKVCREKSLLLNELLDNHSSCMNVAINEPGLSTEASSGLDKEDSSSGVQKRSAAGDIKANVKRSRIAAHSGPIRAAKLSPHGDSTSSIAASESAFCQEPEPWHQQEELDDMLPSAARQRGSNLASPPCTTTGTRNPGSRLQTLASHLNSSFAATGTTESLISSPWQHQFNNSCSPPTLTVSSSVSQTQRPTKTTSLVTSSSLTSTRGPVSVVQHVGSATKYLSPTNRNAAGLLSTSTLPKTITSGNLVINASSIASTAGAAGAATQKPLQSQGAPAYRLSCSSTGQRILIQPSEHGRQIRIQQSDNRLSSVSEDCH